MTAFRIAPAGAVVSFALAAPSLAQPTVFYETDFQKGPAGAEWGATATITDAPTFTRFLGRYTKSEAVKLKLDRPEVPLLPGQSLRFAVTFDFYCIDSWDGEDPKEGQDRFQVLVNGATEFDHTFANVHTWQSYPHEPDVGRAHLGFNASWKDSIYRGITIPFEVPEDMPVFSITFRSQNLLALSDESWGIDNVVVSYEVIPAPGAGFLIGVGAAFTTRRRR